MDRKLIDYLPQILREVREFGSIVQVEQPEVVSLWTELDNVLDDQFINDATENGVKRWENILGIYPKATESLDTRKFRVLTRLNEQLPYTYKGLQQQLISLCGDNGYTIELKKDDYTLIIKIKLYAKNKYDEIKSMLARIVPANIVVDLSILYNSHKELSTLTHSQLSTYTHEQLREVVI